MQNAWIKFGLRNFASSQSHDRDSIVEMPAPLGES
jgi:hypothetical protein